MKKFIIIVTIAIAVSSFATVIITNCSSKNVTHATPDTIEFYHAIALVENGDAIGVDEAYIEVNENEFQRGYRLIKYNGVSYYCDPDDDIAQYKKLNKP